MKNVILLTIDALRKDVLGCYGSGKLTPFIDSIQNQSIRFTHAHSPGPYTQAAFPGILTSSYYLEFGRPQKMLSSKRILISEVLQNAGIVTAGFHSNAHLSDYFGWNRGWDVFYDSMDADVNDMVPYVKARDLNQQVAQWLNTRKAEVAPFFMWLHYMDVHEPYVPDQKYLEAAELFIDIDDEMMFSFFEDVLLYRDVSNPKAVALLKKLYLAHVREVDEAVQELFEILKRNGVLENTVVMIASDHGDEFNEHGGLSHDGKMFSELVEVPLLIHDPALNENQVCDKLVSTIDIAPTIVRLFDVRPPDIYEGTSLLPIEQYPEKGVYGEALDKLGRHEKGDEKEIYYYREGMFKIIYRELDDSWQLYDLEKDPAELKNIFGSSPQSENMKQQLQSRIKRYANPVKTGIDGNRVKELEEKIEKSKDIFKQAFDRFDVQDVRLIWSGGKDSTLTLWICRQFCQEAGLDLPKAFTIDEGDAFEEIDEILHNLSKQWEVDLDWGRNEDVLKAAGYQLNADIEVKDLNDRNQAEIKRIGFDLERFPFEAESYVGNHLMKTVVFNTYLEDNDVKAVFQGLRWDEQSARQKDEYYEDIPEGELMPEHTRYRPILHFTERDIWDTILHYKIPYCPLYEQGYRSLGAKSTSLKSSDIPAWEQDLENTEERAGRRQDKEKTMERLRQLGYM